MTAGTPDDESLCLRCGMCCSGIMFDYVTLRDVEPEAMKALGQSIVTFENEDCFVQPCRVLDHKKCTIYEKRPKACRKYRCETLDQLDDGSIDRAEADRRVDAALACAAKLDDALPTGPTFFDARNNWKDRARKPPFDNADARIRLLVVALNLHLDRHFRSEKDRAIAYASVEKPGDEKPGVGMPSVE